MPIYVPKLASYEMLWPLTKFWSLISIMFLALEPVRMILNA